jgi:hypothetical protein
MEFLFLRHVILRTFISFQLYCDYIGLYCLRTYIVYPTIIPFVEEANQATFLFII